jgi:hypothetical protein
VLQCDDVTIRAAEHGAQFSPARYMRREVPLVSADSHLSGCCTNDMFCMEAIRKTAVLVAPGNPFVCPACQKPLAAKGAAKGGLTKVKSGHGRTDQIPLVTDGPVLKARCVNVRRCTVARRKADIYVRVGNIFVCPECSKPLSTGVRPALKPVQRNNFVLGTCAAVALLAGSNIIFPGAAGSLVASATQLFAPKATAPISAAQAPAPMIVAPAPPAPNPVAEQLHAQGARTRKKSPRSGHVTHHSAAIAA